MHDLRIFYKKKYISCFSQKPIMYKFQIQSMMICSYHNTIKSKKYRQGQWGSRHNIREATIKDLGHLRWDISGFTFIHYLYWRELIGHLFFSCAKRMKSASKAFSSKTSVYTRLPHISYMSSSYADSDIVYESIVLSYNLIYIANFDNGSWRILCFKCFVENMIYMSSFLWIKFMVEI